MKQQSFKTALFAVAVLLSVASCEKDPVVEPAPGPVPPQQQLPNPLPANALVSQLKWAETDHQTFTYNAKGQVLHLRSQWQYDESDPTNIRILDYNFEYDAQDKPIWVSVTGGFSARYAYHGDLVHVSQELYPGSAVGREVTYIYDNNSRIIREMWRVSEMPGAPVTLYKHEFGYDARGNLAKVEIFEQIADSTAAYKLLETTEYSDFDDKINPTSWLLRYPYLPQVRWQFNNPRREVRRPNGGTAQTTTHAYEYNEEGLPVVRRTTGPGGAQTVTYSY